MNIDAYVTLIKQNFQQIAIQKVRPITKGRDSFVLKVNDELIFRFPMRFVGLHHVGGKQFIEQIVMRCQNTIDTAFWQRIDFYLHYRPFSQLLYGSYTKNETFMRQGVEGLRTMFGE